MKGYKATYNMKCRDFMYEVGKTYEMDDIQICKRGFHYCKDPKDVLEYYPYDKNFILLEVEDLGNTITEGDKSVTNKLKIVRVIPRKEYEFLLDIKVNDEGRILYQKYFNGLEVWREYNINGKLTYSKDSTGYEYWKEYDSKGNEIHYNDSNGYEYWNEYDSKGNLIHYKDSNGYEYWNEYDSEGNMIHYKDSYGYEEWNEYDSEGNMIHYKDSNGNEFLPNVKMNQNCSSHK